MFFKPSKNSIMKTTREKMIDFANYCNTYHVEYDERQAAHEGNEPFDEQLKTTEALYDEFEAKTEKPRFIISGENQKPTYPYIDDVL